MTLPAQKRPCANCPWRLDVEPGEFTVERYRDLAKTAYDMGVMLFACHKSIEGEDVTCAGFLARGADHNWSVRLAYSQGHLEWMDRTGGLALHPNYRAMAEANGVDPDDPVLGQCR